jgi:hypothetical protein
MVLVNATNVGFGIHITGMTAAPNGTIVTLVNSAYQPFLSAIQTNNDNTGSVATNRFVNQAQSDAMGFNQSAATYRYNTALTTGGAPGRWQQLSST